MIDIGSVVNGKYRLVRLLGDGGMGSVYEALHVGLGTRVAIKVLHPELNRRTGLVERFLQEARVAAQIRSVHVVQVTDVDRTPDGHAYIVMELLEGEVLSSVLDRQRSLPVSVASEYAAQVLEALEAAHALGVIHRDLKPENVFVTFSAGKPVLKLIDFGIAKARRVDARQKSLTVAGVVMGTAEYMAPEQAQSADRVDPRSDIYAVGVMLYEMIAGARPVHGEDARVIAVRVQRGEVVPLVQAAPDVPPEVAGLVHRAMAGRPQLRFATATEMRLALLATGGGARGAPRPVLSPVPGPRTAPSGTVECLGEQVRAASVPAPVRSSAEPESPHADTIRAPPPATALTAPYMGGAFRVAGAQRHERSPPRGRGPLLVLLTLPVVVGAGLVALFVATGTGQSGPSAPAVQVPAAYGVSNRAVATADPAAMASAGGGQVPTLTPTRIVGGAALAGVRPSGSRSWSPSAATGPDAGPPTLGLPPGMVTVLPPFPPVLPSGVAIPSGFPTSFPAALPSTLPTALPSGFPSVLPAWPPPMPTAPGAAPAAGAAAPASY
ncbi:MAG: protein kinase [Polyangiaceae bacterium]